MAGTDDPRAAGTVPSGTGEPGTLSRLLLEIARAPDDDLASSWRESLKPGETVGRYQVRQEIGRGGFGAVYEAFDPELGRSVALKTLRPGRPRRELTQDWVKREAEAIARLDHPGIVTVHDVGACPAGPYLVMERLHGETLAQRLERGPISPDEALRIAEDMARPLAHAHRRGVLHRDLKPANVFLTDDGRVKLLDFGLAHLLGQEGGSSGGTPAYMAPEQARGEPVDERADVYAAGMVLGEMLTGRRPVDPATPSSAAPPRPGSRTEVLWPGESGPAGLRGPPPPEAGSTRPRLPRVPRPVARAIAAALAAAPANRPRDGTAWLEALRSARRALERPRALRRVSLLGSAFLLLGLLIAGLATWRVWERELPSGRVTVAVADFANETGEKELDSISGLLITALEQSAQLRVLTRGRMFDVLRQLGKERVDRIDEPLAREVGRETNSRALLLATIRRLGDAYVVDMRALDPLRDEYLFTVRDRATGPAAVFDLVDRLGQETRRRLRAGGGTGSAPQPRVASITTQNVKAWELLFRSRQALDQHEGKRARELAEAALVEDPEFALARYQLALSAYWGTDGAVAERGEAARARVEASLQVVDRLPEKERTSLLAIRAALDGRQEEARRLWDQLAEAFPLDKEALFHAGDVRLHGGDRAGAVPYFARALRLDPSYRAARDHLAMAVTWSGHAAEHLGVLRELAASTLEASSLRSFADGLLAAGQEDEAIDAYRRAARHDGQPWPPVVYVQYLISAGRAEEAERLLRDGLTEPSRSQHGPWARGVRGWLVALLLAQGRLTEATALGGLASGSEPGEREPPDAAFDRLWYAAIAGSARKVHSALAELERLGADLDPGGASTAVLGLLMAGDAAGAKRLAGRAMADPRWRERTAPDDRLLGIVAAFDRGLAASVRAAPARGDDLHATIGYLGLYLEGRLWQDAEGCDLSVKALEEARAAPWTPGGPQRSWTRPSLLHALALCHERTGDLAKARERNAEMLRLWARADPDLPLLVEAKALKTRLEAR